MIRRVFISCLLLLLLIVLASLALGQECKRKTPIRYIGICAHPHGPMHSEWTYDFSGHPVLGPAARQLVACHDVLPLFVFDPRADLKNRGLMPMKFQDKALACEPPPPPRPKPAPAKKQDPPIKEKADGDEGGGGGSGGGGKRKDDEPNVEERVEKYRIRSESTPEEARRPKNDVQGVLSKEPQLPRESGILSKEGVLPSRDEVRPPRCVDEQCTMVDRGGALPELQHRQGRPLVSVVSCKQTKEGCKGEHAGDGTGQQKALTPLERMVRELSIASAMLNGEFNHDLARKDGKRFGIIGGSSEDGVDSAIVQAAAAIAQVASGVLVGQAETFAKKLEEACAKKAPLIIEGAEKVSKETAELLAQQYGRAIAEALEQNGAIGPYKTMREFTRGLEGDFQAHHILEKAMGRDLGLTKEQLDNIPSVILTEAQHKRITRLLDLKRPKMKLDSQTLWDLYEEVYEPFPHWLEAIKPYFGK
ncbi:hypothetical protein [Polyangium spumosum]|uniref:Uncharacterized protein n=1 Tax=Polyangium spumosum TaxID=889282 RepID=A0A6N7PWF6_9BACT|nr:hypothetical protein [Polyangium spumosum]MRG96562.1 hypothetical protein [Polyangium spumosum]